MHLVTCYCNAKADRALALSTYSMLRKFGTLAFAAPKCQNLEAVAAEVFGSWQSRNCHSNLHADMLCKAQPVINQFFWKFNLDLRYTVAAFKTTISLVLWCWAVHFVIQHILAYLAYFEHILAYLAYFEHILLVFGNMRRAYYAKNLSIFGPSLSWGWVVWSGNFEHRSF